MNIQTYPDDSLNSVLFDQMCDLAGMAYDCHVSGDTEAETEFLNQYNGLRDLLARCGYIKPSTPQPHTVELLSEEVPF